MGAKRKGLGTIWERPVEAKKGNGMSKPHRATGNPRGRPPKISFDFGRRIMENLRQRVDPETGLVRPRWKQIARELGVSRSTIARQMAELYASGAYERIYIKVNPRVTICYYRLKD